MRAKKERPVQRSLLLFFLINLIGDLGSNRQLILSLLVTHNALRRRWSSQRRLFFLCLGVAAGTVAMESLLVV